MSNIQHSSRKDTWYTPQWVIDKVYNVLETIDLDPASDVFGNQRIKAINYWDEFDDALSFEWSGKVDYPVKVYMNPPGGRIGNKSKTALFWQKLLDLRKANMLNHAIVMGFSLEQLAVTQSCSLGMADFPVCIPKRRIRFESSEGHPNSPTHANVICYVPGLENKTSVFKETFSNIGKLMHPG